MADYNNTIQSSNTSLVSDPICIFCHRTFGVNRNKHKVCMVCHPGQAHQSCFQKAILGSAHNRCPVCDTPLLMDGSNNSILLGYQSLHWYISVKNQCLFTCFILLVSIVSMVLIHLFLKFILVLFNIRLTSKPNNGTELIINQTEWVINELVPCYPESLKSYLFCYSQSLFTLFDFVWVLIVWIIVLLLSIIFVLIFNMCKYDKDGYNTVVQYTKQPIKSHGIFQKFAKDSDVDVWLVDIEPSKNNKKPKNKPSITPMKGQTMEQKQKVNHFVNGLIQIFSDVTEQMTQGDTGINENTSWIVEGGMKSDTEEKPKNTEPVPPLNQSIITISDQSLDPGVLPGSNTNIPQSIATINNPTKQEEIKSEDADNLLF